jgi:hypothetical protein
MKSKLETKILSYFDGVLMYLNVEESITLINRHIKCTENMLLANENGEIEAERGYAFTSQEIESHKEVIKISKQRMSEVLINGCGAYIGNDESRQKMYNALIIN